MTFRWSDRREIRPNVKVHPLDAYKLKERLRGADVDERDERAETVIVYLFAGIIIGGILGLILVVA